MNDTPLGILFGLLAFLIICSGFFSSSETGMMSINRYRLSHKAKNKDKSALRVSRLLERPDRLIGVILIGNNFVNILASSIATIIAIRLYGDAGIAIATALLTLVILIFAEVTPKTLAAMHPERVAYPASLLLTPLLKIMYPLVFMVNVITNGLLRLMGINQNDSSNDQLTPEELRTVVLESGSMIPRRHKTMLLSILDLESMTVNDIMIPRHEIQGIDLDDSMDSIMQQLQSCRHTRLILYKGDINNVLGILHMRHASRFMARTEPAKEDLLAEAREPYFIPETTPLQTQLLHFQKLQRRIAIVVDEYGDVMGIVTLEDILEEIVGDFTSPMSGHNDEIQPEPPSAEAETDEPQNFIVDGTASIRDINKSLDWALPVDGPKTLNGLIMEQLESIPEAHVCLRIDDYYLETTEIQGNLVQKVRCWMTTSSEKE
ncbi:HlyC/CorC family transporter [Oceanospirillum sediminis]|uniref:HlyC/CorC family transporter n=1 Tax=Oceanospirillum sediminis TaxID=2760088 RepID=A0A839ILC7_9GAMM|nr:HlyC/CorC family transporter [Oceanospirillum sediminis]MBB1485299.1 HlyC/CorC family transporter [Oceanospirillum sediminis]